MMIVLKYLPLILQLVSILKDVVELGKKMYEVTMKRAKTIQDGQQTSIEDRELLKINQELGTKNADIAEVVYDYAVPPEEKSNADKPEIKELLTYIQQTAAGLVGIVCVATCLKTSAKKR